MVAIEVMQLSGDNVCAKLGFLKETVKKVVTFSSKSQIYKHITHSPDNSIISVKLHFVQYGFLLRPGHGPIYEGGVGGAWKKTQVKGKMEKRKT